MDDRVKYWIDLALQRTEFVSSKIRSFSKCLSVPACQRGRKSTHSLRSFVAEMLVVDETREGVRYSRSPRKLNFKKNQVRNIRQKG
jgi:hypothetical protein